VRMAWEARAAHPPDAPRPACAERPRLAPTGPVAAARTCTGPGRWSCVRVGSGPPSCGP